MLLPDAVLLVHQYSKGIPRLINLICEHAMISAYAEQIKPITPRIVESVCAELDLHKQSFLISPSAPSGFPENTSSTAISADVKIALDTTDSMKEREI